jgi:hypothetical protein
MGSKTVENILFLVCFVMASPYIILPQRSVALAPGTFVDLVLRSYDVSQAVPEEKGSCGRAWIVNMTGVDFENNSLYVLQDRF